MNQRESQRERHVSSRLLFLFICCFAATVAAAGQQLDAPVQAHVLMPPAPTKGSDGKMHVEYEVHVTSPDAGNGPLRLTKLRVFAQGAEAPLASYEARNWVRWRGPGVQKVRMEFRLPRGSAPCSWCG